MRRLSRFLATFVLGLALFQAVGSRLPGLIVACVESCPDDEGGACSVVCDCACRTAHRIPLVAPIVLPEPLAAVKSFEVAKTNAPPAPDPRALLHVPRARLG